MIETIKDISSEIVPHGIANSVSLHDGRNIYAAIDEIPIDNSYKLQVAQIGDQDWRVREGLRQLQNYDPASFKHVVRVSAIAGHLAETSGLDERETRLLVIGAMLHDIGKIALDINIVHPKDEAACQISKSQKDRRFAAIKMHPEAGFNIATNLFRDEEDPETRTILPMLILTHHCHNASGERYPDNETMVKLEEEGLLRVDDLEDIVLQRLASILAVADVYEAITAARTYTKDKGFEDPNRVEQVLIGSHPTMTRSIAELMDLHTKRFPPSGWMPEVAWSERGQ